MSNMGPQYPRSSGESCECGGVFVFTGHNDDGKSVWKCGPCGRVMIGPNVRRGGVAQSTRDIMQNPAHTTSTKDIPKEERFK